MGKRAGRRRHSQYNNKSIRIEVDPGDAETDRFQDDTHFDLLLPPVSRWAIHIFDSKILIPYKQRHSKYL
jgi:hypothetical protein